MTQDALTGLPQRRQPISDGPDIPIRDISNYIQKTVPIADMNPGLSPTKMPKLSDLFKDPTPTDKENPITADSWEISYAKDTLTDYILFRFPNRDIDGGTFTFRFLVNPSSIQVDYNTVDSQAFTRAGMQFGVWGEDLIQISMSGKTAGAYFNNGLTDTNKRFSQAYRNLLDFQHLFENNGYWYEGEDLVTKKLTAEEVAKVFSASRKLIKCHEDVQLVYGNFIWYGMFESMTYSSTADTPFLDTFKFNFIAWKERYRSSSPYRNSIRNDVMRGHTYGAWDQLGKIQQDKSDFYEGKKVTARTTGSVDLDPVIPALDPAALPSMAVLTPKLPGNPLPMPRINK